MTTVLQEILYKSEVHANASSSETGVKKPLDMLKLDIKAFSTKKP